MSYHQIIATIKCRFCDEEHDIEIEGSHIPVMTCKLAPTGEGRIVDTRYWMKWDYDQKKPTRVIAADYDGLLLVVHPEDHDAANR
jgi:hypothetical protein